MNTKARPTLVLVSSRREPAAEGTPVERAFRLVRPPPLVLPKRPDGILFHARGLTLTRDALAVGHERFPLREVAAVATQHTAPRALPSLVGAGLAAVLAVVLLVARLPAGALGLGLCMAAFLACVAHLLTLHDSYWLVVKTPRGEKRVWCSEEPEPVGKLLATLRDALGGGSEAR